MIVDYEIKTVSVPIGAGMSTARYGVFENGNLVDCVYEYEAAKMIVNNRRDQWKDHGE